MAVWQAAAGHGVNGFCIFNLVEGVIDHYLLNIHHVNETVPPDQWTYWDIGFLVWGAALLIGGWLLKHAGQRKTAYVHGAEGHQTTLR